MNFKCFIILLLTIASYFFCFNDLKAHGVLPVKYNSKDINIGLVMIQVGNKINDSTGQVTISNSDIQSSIISNIDSLANCLITSEVPTLIVGRFFSYLVFKATNPASENIRVAIELIIEGNVLKFQSSPGKQLHICKNLTGCSNCNYIKDRNKTIIGCNCSVNPTAAQGCKHTFLLTK